MELNTCDLLLCSGNGTMSQIIVAMNRAQAIKDAVADGSATFKWLSGELQTDLSLQLSHLALAINITEEEHEANAQLWHYIPSPGVYVWESTTGNTDWSGVSGVQINPYAKWLEMYDGRVWKRNIVPETPIHNTKAITDMINMVGLPYESGIPGLLELALTFNKDIRIDTEEPHCTEGGVIVNKKHGIFKPETDEHKMPPCKFGNGQVIESLVNGEISPMRWLK